MIVYIYKDAEDRLCHYLSLVMNCNQLYLLSHNLWVTLKVVDLICKPAQNILKFGMNEECTILITYMNFQSCTL